MGATENRRSKVRREADQDVEFDLDGARHSAHMLDISGSGAYLTTETKLRPGQIVTLEMRGKKVFALAGVRRVDLSGIGIEFDDKTIGSIVSGYACAITRGNSNAA